MKLDCTTDKYGEIYARWLDRGDNLIDRYCNATQLPMKGLRVLDLAGGTGVVSEVCTAHQAKSVVLLDPNPRPSEVLLFLSGLPNRFRPVTGYAENMEFDQEFDVVFCRQALGYLNLEESFDRVARSLAPGGHFVFNNFVRPRWHLKSYKHYQRRFFELGGYFGKTVYHLQVALGVGWDVTRFKWHTLDDILPPLQKHFDLVDFQYTAKSSYFVCKVKSRS